MIHVTSNLVFLDVTVVDDKGKPVTKGLKREDFTITEDKKPQRIFSFEAPEEHGAAASSDADNPDGKAPVSIYILDTLNEAPEDIAYYRFEFDRYLKTLPAQLAAPAELLVVGNESLELVQSYTRSRDELLTALHHVPATYPYKQAGASFGAERFVQSVDAIQQIALQNRGVAGRKNIFWLGEGGPAISRIWLSGNGVERLKQYTHETANMLVEERITLFVFYPGLKVRIISPQVVGGAFATDGNPFSSDVSFGAIVNETGGSLYYNRNDIDAELARSERKGSQFYTLTYQPADGVQDGKFRKIHVTLRQSYLHILTKAGYFAPDKDLPEDPRRKGIQSLAEAARTTLPLTALNLRMARVIRHPDAQTVEVSFLVPASKLQWQKGDPGTSNTSVRIAAVGFSKSARTLVWKVQELALKTGTDDPQLLAKGVIPVFFTVSVPAKLQKMRIMLEPSDESQIGALDLTRQQIEAAPEQPSASVAPVSQKPAGVGAQ